MSDPMVLTGAAGFGFSAGGAASSVLDGITAASDGKTADGSFGSPGLGVQSALIITVESHPHLPSSVDVDVRHERTLGQPTLEAIILYDANDVPLYSIEPGATLPGSMAVESFALAKVYSGLVDSSADWTLEVIYKATEETIGLSVDQVEGVFDVSGEHGSGPGGQLGQNAAILIPTMVSL